MNFAVLASFVPGSIATRVCSIVSEWVLVAFAVYEYCQMKQVLPMRRTKVLTKLGDPELKC